MRQYLAGLLLSIGGVGSQALCHDVRDRNTCGDRYFSLQKLEKGIEFLLFPRISIHYFLGVLVWHVICDSKPSRLADGCRDLRRD